MLGFSLSKILERTRTYDLFCVISLAGAVNLVTGPLFDSGGLLRGAIILIAAASFIVSGYGFHWLAFTSVRCLESNAHSVVNAAADIRSREREGTFQCYHATSFLAFAIAVLAALGGWCSSQPWLFQVK